MTASSFSFNSLGGDVCDLMSWHDTGSPTLSRYEPAADR